MRATFARSHLALLLVCVAGFRPPFPTEARWQFSGLRLAQDL